MPVPRHLIKLYPVAGAANNKLAIYKHALFGEFPYGFQCRSCDCLLSCLCETSWSTQQGDSKKVILYLTAGIIIFDTLVLRAFQKYTICLVFKAVQLFKKSAIWFSENSSVLVELGFPYCGYNFQNGYKFAQTNTNTLVFWFWKCFELDHSRTDSLMLFLDG